MKYIFILFALVLGCAGQPVLQKDGQSLEHTLKLLVNTHQVTTWKYNAKGAYSIIFDDYCKDEVHGIQDYAAPEAEKRGLVIGFGVVTSFCDAHEWQRAREMVAAGHEVINHSHTHRCGEPNSEWCKDEWTDAEVYSEIDKPAKLIRKHTGVRPTFFIFPFDVFTLGKVEHLRQSGYLGARTGDKRKLTSANFVDPFVDLNFDVKFPAESAASQGYGLNEYVDLAIAQGQFAFREAHGVEDQSWGPTSLEELRDHFDYVQSRVQSYDLWMATISDVIRYSRARSLCKLDSGIDRRGAWLRMSGDDRICQASVGLSLKFGDMTGLQLKDKRGIPLEQINGTYNLETGKTYYIESI